LSGDFLLTEDGHVVPKAGATATAAPAPQPAKGNGTGGVRLRVPPRWLSVITNNSPIVIPSTVSATPTQPAPTAPPSQQALAAAQLARAVTCPLPAFPYPAEWEQLGAAVSGPITSHSYDGPPNAKAFESSLIGKLPTPFRTLQFASDCRPLLIAIGDNSRRGQFEIWTPAGLLTHTRADGFLELPGFGKNVLPGSLVRSETSARINRRGVIAFPVVYDTDSYTILLATPAAH
jgi:hypothetical protein